MATRSMSHMSGYSQVSYPASLAYSLGQPIIRKTYQYTPPSRNFVIASSIAFVGTILLVISFTSPYWLVSYMYTYNPFKNIGLWEICFDGYRYPKYQFDHKFTGCNYIFYHEYRIIWEWMLPAWYQITQTFVSLALIACLTCLVTCSCVLIRWPMQLVMRYEWLIIGFCALTMAATVLSLFFGVLIFGIMCWSRDWLQNPNFNYLGFSYYCAVFSGGFCAFAGFMMLHETFAARERKRETNNLLHMEPQSGNGVGAETGEPAVEPQYQHYSTGPSYAMGSNPGFSREQSVHSAASGFSQPMPHQYSAYM